MVDLPATEVRPGDAPVLPRAVGFQDEGALARADEDPDSAHCSVSCVMRYLRSEYGRSCPLQIDTPCPKDLPPEGGRRLRYPNRVNPWILYLATALIVATCAPAQARQQDPALRERVNRVGSDLFSPTPHP